MLGSASSAIMWLCMYISIGLNWSMFDHVMVRKIKKMPQCPQTLSSWGWGLGTRWLPDPVPHHVQHGQNINLPLADREHQWWESPEPVETPCSIHRGMNSCIHNVNIMHKIMSEIAAEPVVCWLSSSSCTATVQWHHNLLIVLLQSHKTGRTAYLNYQKYTIRTTAPKKYTQP